MHTEFKLSGQGNQMLADIVINSVANHDYTEEQLADFRVPIAYDSSDYVFNSDNIAEREHDILRMAYLSADISLSHNKGIKSFFKRFLYKTFRWYVVPLAGSQIQINYKVLQITCGLSKQINALEKRIQIMEQK